MTFVGKVLVVVQVVLSVCFMAFAAAVYTTPNNWKLQHEQLVEKSTQTEADLNAELEKIKNENSALQAKANDTQTKADMLQNSVVALTQERDTIAAEVERGKRRQYQGTGTGGESRNRSRTSQK